MFTLNVIQRTEEGGSVCYQYDLSSLPEALEAFDSEVRVLQLHLGGRVAIFFNPPKEAKAYRLHRTVVAGDGTILD